MNKYEEENFFRNYTADKNEESLKIHRKWSTNNEMMMIHDHVPDSLKKYIEVAMWEYREIKKEENPC